MTLVAGVDSSTQSCKVVVRDAETGRLVRQGRAPHPDGTEIDPDLWWAALQHAIADAGGLADVAAVSVAAQQHGMVCLDESGELVRDALLWNDVRSAAAADELVRELGAATRAQRTGSVPVASFTVTKLRWLAEHEPANAARVAAVCLPHDWLSWRLRGCTELTDLVTDRSDASGTGYFDSCTNEYQRDLVRLALGRDDVVLPRVLAPAESVPGDGFVLGAGMGDNAAAMLGLDAGEDLLASIGTSGVLMASAGARPADPSGTVAGFADAEGAHLPLVCTLNAARVLVTIAELLGVGVGELSDLALSAEAGAGGVVLVPYLDGERTPNLPLATGAVHGLTLANTGRPNLARAAVEGMLCGLAAAIDPLLAAGVRPRAVRLIGGGAASIAVRELAAGIFGLPVVVPAPGEYVADGAARQAAWALAATADPPSWRTQPPVAEFATPDRPSTAVRQRYAQAATLHL